MFEWRVTVHCPVRSLDAAEEFERGGEFHRRLYVWTEQLSASDAYREALRILEGWPLGTRILEVAPVGMYAWESSMEEPPEPEHPPDEPGPDDGDGSEGGDGEQAPQS